MWRSDPSTTTRPSSHTDSGTTAGSTWSLPASSLRTVIRPKVNERLLARLRIPDRRSISSGDRIRLQLSSMSSSYSSWRRDISSGSCTHVCVNRALYRRGRQTLSATSTIDECQSKDLSGAFEVAGNLIPVDQIPESCDIVRPPVLVFQIVGVFPYVETQ